MGNYGISNVGAGAGEGVGGMVNGTGLTLVSVARSGACGGIDNELAEVGGFSAGDKWGLVRGSCVDGFEERLWKPPLRIRVRRRRPE